MGRRNKTYSKDLHQQAYDQLTGMLAFGESKKEAMATGTAKNKIFSHATYKNYWKHIKYFLGYIKEKHPECTTLKNAKKYVNEWLQTRVDQGLSAWTVQLEAKALGKLYGISPDDEAYFDPPKRNRQDIKRSRGDRVRDQHFSKTNNDELIKFCRGTGLRRRELQELRGKDLVSKEQIEAELSELEKIPEAQQAPSVARRLEILRDTQLFPEAQSFIHADGSVSVRSSASTRIRSRSGSRTHRQRKRSGSTSTPAPISTATGRSMPRPSTRLMPGPSRTSRMTRLTAALGGVTRARCTPAARMRPGESWTRPPCWFAVRRWAITASALWQITTFGVCKGGVHHG